MFFFPSPHAISLNHVRNSDPHVAGFAIGLRYPSFSVAQGPSFVADYRRMPEGSANPAQRWTAAITAIVAALWFCYAGGKHTLASHYALSSNHENWEWALRIEPDNPEIMVPVEMIPASLISITPTFPYPSKDYRRAIQLNPRSPYYKLDLAGALEMAGKNDEADSSFRGAQAAYPISAEVSWKYGNFLLRQNRLPEAYAEIHRAVMVDPQLIPLAVSRVWHSDPDVHLLLDQILPNTTGAYSEALTFLADAQDPAAALVVWQRLIAKDPHTDLKLTFKLTDMLTAREKFDEAGVVWRQAVARDPGSALRVYRELARLRWRIRNGHFGRRLRLAANGRPRRGLRFRYGCEAFRQPVSAAHV